MNYAYLAARHMLNQVPLCFTSSNFYCIYNQSKLILQQNSRESLISSSLHSIRNGDSRYEIDIRSAVTSHLSRLVIVEICSKPQHVSISQLNSSRLGSFCPTSRVFYMLKMNYLHEFAPVINH